MFTLNNMFFFFRITHEIMSARGGATRSGIWGTERSPANFKRSPWMSGVSAVPAVPATGAVEAAGNAPPGA